MFRALLCPSSVARDYNVNYHISRFGLGLLYIEGYVRLGWSSVRAAPNLQHTANQERKTNVVINIIVTSS